MPIDVNLSLIMGCGLVFIGSVLFFHNVLFHTGQTQLKLGKSMKIKGIIREIQFHYGVIGWIFAMIGIVLMLGS